MVKFVFLINHAFKGEIWERNRRKMKPFVLLYQDGTSTNSEMHAERRSKEITFSYCAIDFIYHSPPPTQFYLKQPLKTTLKYIKFPPLVLGNRQHSPLIFSEMFNFVIKYSAQYCSVLTEFCENFKPICRTSIGYL